MQPELNSGDTRADSRSTRTYLQSLQDVAAPVEEVLQELAGLLRGQRSGLVPPVPPGLASPWLLGQAREALHDSTDRSALGAWFTPRSVARTLLSTVGGPQPGLQPLTIIDPACGGGAFLLAAHDRFPDAHLAGLDVDPVAVEVTRAALDLAGCCDVDVRVADGLEVPPRRYDLVVGNPPFLSQLQAKTARSPDRRQWLDGRFGSVASGYVDDAALFVLVTVRDLLDERGEAVLVVPEAILATADTLAIREEVAAVCDVEVVWRDRDGAFPGTATCALRLIRRPARRMARRMARRIPQTANWSELLAADVPRATVRTGADASRERVVGDTATATADFRETHYLLADHVVEGFPPSGKGHRIVTVGLIDPAHLRWGEVEMRFAKRRWLRPVAVGLPQAFLDKRMGPKLLVATQTKVLEVVADAAGDLVPSTPVITVRTERLWHVGAALSSPVATAVAARRHAGAAISRGALKLSAKQVMGLPLPGEESAEWDLAAETFRQAHQASDPAARRQLLLKSGRAMVQAYKLLDGKMQDGEMQDDEMQDDALLDWWQDRLPRR